MEIYKAKTDIPNYEISKGEIFSVDWNDDYDIDRYAANLYVWRYDKWFYLGFIHEDTAATIGCFAEGESTFTTLGNISHADSVTPLIFNQLPIMIQKEVTAKATIECKKHLKSKMPLRARSFVKSDDVKTWLKNQIMELKQFHEAGVNVHQMAYKMLKDHNDAVAAKRKEIDAGKNSLGNMFPELRKLAS